MTVRRLDLLTGLKATGLVEINAGIEVLLRLRSVVKLNNEVPIKALAEDKFIAGHPSELIENAFG